MSTTAKASGSTRDEHSPAKLRILMVSSQFIPIMGGAEMHTYEVGRRLSAMGHQVTVLTTDSGRHLPASEIIEGIRVTRVRTWTPDSDLFFAPGIARYIRSHASEWDVVHCQGWHNFVPPMAMMAAVQEQLPFVVTFHSGGHSSRLRTHLRGVQGFALRPLFAKARRLIGVSRFESRLFQKRLKLDETRFTVIPNGAQLPAIEQKPETPGLIVSIGRLERYKGHHRIIEAMPKVIDQVPEAHLLVLGSGPYDATLKRLATKLGLEGSVHFRSIPPNDRTAVARTLASAELVTLLSDYEAHPIAMMEALSLGRKLLVTYSSGLAELADDGLAASVPLNASATEIAEAVAASLRSPASAPVTPLPTWEECTSQILRLYHAISCVEPQP